MIKHFSKNEFTCKCGCDETFISDEFLEITSAHIKGLAADIRCSDGVTRARMMDALVYAGFERFGLHKSFIHVDIDNKEKPSPAIWLY